MKAKLDFEPVLHWTNPLTFPGWLSLAEARSESRPGKARRYAVKSLDTDLHRTRQTFPSIRGMSFSMSDLPVVPR